MLKHALHLWRTCIEHVCQEAHRGDEARISGDARVDQDSHLDGLLLARQRRHGQLHMVGLRAIMANAQQSWTQQDVICSDS